MSLSNLPSDVLRHVLFTPDMLDTVSLTVMRFVSRRFRAIIPVQKKYPKPPWSIDGVKAPDIFATCALKGYIDIMRWAYSQRAPLSIAVYEYATYSADQHVLQWLRSLLIPYDERSCLGAIRSGNLEVLKSIRQAGAPWHINAWATAACWNQVEVMKYLKEQDVPRGTQIWTKAARWGRLNILKYLHEERIPVDDDVWTYAAYGGNLEVCELLRGYGIPLNVSQIYGGAVTKSQRDVFYWLQRQGIELTATAACKAIEFGNPEFIKWLRGQGCPWHEYICMWAVWDNQLDLLKWLREQGCPWDYQRCLAIAENETTVWMTTQSSRPS